MDGFEMVTSIDTLNSVDRLESLFAGKVVEANLSNKGLLEREATVVVSRLLIRSENTLEILNLRWYC